MSVVGFALMLSIDANNNHSYYLACLGIIFLLLGRALVKVFPCQLTAQREITDTLVSRTENTYIITIRNQTARKLSGVVVKDSFNLKHPKDITKEERDGALSFKLTSRADKINNPAWNQVATPVATILPYSETNVTMHITPEHRGLLFFENITIICPEPFGLCVSCCYNATSNVSIVRPRFLPQSALNKQLALENHHAGDSISGYTSGGDLFSNLRPYEFGDSLRSVYWREFSKTNNLVVKEFKESKKKSFLIVVDNYQTNHSEDAIEKNISTTLNLISICRKYREPTIILLFGKDFYLHSGLDDSVFNLESFLSLLVSHPEDDFSRLTKNLIKKSKSVESIIVVMSGKDPKRREFLENLPKVVDRRKVSIVDNERVDFLDDLNASRTEEMRNDTTP